VHADLVDFWRDPISRRTVMACNKCLSCFVVDWIENKVLIVE